MSATFFQAEMHACRVWYPRNPGTALSTRSNSDSSAVTACGFERSVFTVAIRGSRDSISLGYERRLADGWALGQGQSPVLPFPGFFLSSPLKASGT